MNKFKEFCDRIDIGPSESASEQAAFLAAKCAWNEQQREIDRLKEMIRSFTGVLSVMNDE